MQGASMVKLFVLSVAASAVGLLGCAHAAAAKFEPEHARAGLISESTRLIPGETQWLALDFEIDDGWHLYWEGTNDSGFPPKLNATAPSGYRIGEMLWPAPK